jgi:hypothetical protein
MIAIWPAGPPKLIIPSFSQNQNASRSVGVDACGSTLVSAADAGAPSERRLSECCWLSCRTVSARRLSQSRCSPIVEDSGMNLATMVAQLS